MRYKLVLLFVFMAMFMNLYSNSNDSIKVNVIKYLIECEELDEIEDINEYNDNVYIVDIMQYKALSEEVGVYKFGTFTSHSKAFLLLKGKASCKMLNVERLDLALMEVIGFLRDNNFGEQDIIKYVEKVIKLYQSNLEAIPWTEEY